MNDLMEQKGNQLQVQSSNTQIAISREVQEVQGLIIAAKNFRREVPAAINRIEVACKDKRLAEVARYEYPRGKTVVSGPSIRLAEVLAQNWGNMIAEWRVIRSDADSSEIEARCWDMETNFMVRRSCTVEHMRHTKNGSYKLTDSRDIYEMQANQAARRLRACILAVIPAGIIRLAEEVCDTTLEHALKGEEKTMSKDQRLAAILRSFDEWGILQSDIERLFRHKFEAISNNEIVKLRRILQSLKDGIGKKEDYFPTDDVESEPTDKPAKPEQPKVRENEESLAIFDAEVKKALSIGISESLVYKTIGINKGDVEKLDKNAIYKFVQLIGALIDYNQQQKAAEQEQAKDKPSNDQEPANTDIDPKSKLDASDGVARNPLKAYDMILKMDYKASEYKPEVHDLICSLYDKDLRIGDDVKIAQMVRMAEKGNGKHLEDLKKFADSRKSLIE